MIVVMCDTNGGSMPEEVAALTKEAAAAVDVPLGIHTHNDCDLAVANSLAAVDAGAVHVQGTINGLGERCGNADLISVMANLALKKQGYEVLGGAGSEHLTELSRYVYEVANMHFRDQPAVRRHQRVCPQRRHARARRQPRGPELRAHHARERRQHPPRPGERAFRPLEHRCAHEQSESCSKTAR